MENNTKVPNNYICTRKKQFILNLATFLSARFDVSKLEAELDKNQEKLNEVIERLQTSGNDNLKVIDLTNVDTIADNELFTEDYDNLINFINVNKENVKTLESLDIDVHDMSFKDVAIMCYQISKVPSIVANTLMSTVLNDNGEEEVNDLYVNAIANICAERMNREKFLTDNGLIPEGKKWTDVTEAYSEAYNNWVIEEAVRILMRIKAFPNRSVAIYPEGVEECKNTIRSILPVDVDTSFLDECAYEDLGNDVFTKHIQDIINKMPGLDIPAKREIYMKIWQAIVTMNDKNSVGTMDTGNEDNSMSKGNIISAVNLPEATAHIFLLASNDLYGEDGHVEDTTKYLEDIIGSIFDRLDLAYGKYTAARILSVFVLAVPYPIASSMLFKSRDNNFMSICNHLGGILLDLLAQREQDKLHSENIDAAKEKGDTDGNKE